MSAVNPGMDAEVFEQFIGSDTCSGDSFLLNEKS
jgi:hypothetical protein